MHYGFVVCWWCTIYVVCVVEEHGMCAIAWYSLTCFDEAGVDGDNGVFFNVGAEEEAAASVQGCRGTNAEVAVVVVE